MRARSSLSEECPQVGVLCGHAGVGAVLLLDVVDHEVGKDEPLPPNTCDCGLSRRLVLFKSLLTGLFSHRQRRVLIPRRLCRTMAVGG